MSPWKMEQIHSSSKILHLVFMDVADWLNFEQQHQICSTTILPYLTIASTIVYRSQVGIALNNFEKHHFPGMLLYDFLLNHTLKNQVLRGYCSKPNVKG